MEIPDSTFNTSILGSNSENLVGGYLLLPGVDTPTQDENDLRELAAAVENGQAPAEFVERAQNRLAAMSSLQQAKGRGEAYRAVGMFVSDLGTKVGEGISDLKNRFTNGINSFQNLGSKLPSTASLLGGTAPTQFAPPNLFGALGGNTFGLGFGGSSLDVTATAQSVNEVIKIQDAGEDRSHLVVLENTITREIIEFIVMPEIVENRSVSYEAVSPSQFPGSFQKYKGTESVQWQMNATFISRTSAEASLNLKNLNWLRGWTMPFFGDHTLESGRFKNRLGAPPPVLKFRGFRKSMIGEVPVVITSLSWNWPKDVDYIPAMSPDESASNIPFPTVIQLSIQLVESFSTKEFNQFSLEDYLLGNMIDAYGQPTVDTKSRYEGQNFGTSTNEIPQQEAQSVPNGGRGRGIRSDIDSAQRVFDGLGDSVKGGRGNVIPDLVTPAISELKTAASESGAGESGSIEVAPAVSVSAAQPAAQPAPALTSSEIEAKKSALNNEIGVVIKELQFHKAQYNSLEPRLAAATTKAEMFAINLELDAAISDIKRASGDFQRATEQLAALGP